WYHHGDKVTSFVWIVRAAATRAFLFDSFFGGNAIPEMKAVAVAKPTGGSIEEGRQDYIVKLMPVATVMFGNQLVGALPTWLRGFMPENAGRGSDDHNDRGGRK